MQRSLTRIIDGSLVVVSVSAAGRLPSGLQIALHGAQQITEPFVVLRIVGSRRWCGYQRYSNEHTEQSLIGHRWFATIQYTHFIGIAITALKRIGISYRLLPMQCLKNPISYDIPEQLHQNSPIINDFWLRRSSFICLLIVGEKFHTGRETPARFP